jgi:hypothetical protein
MLSPGRVSPSYIAALLPASSSLLRHLRRPRAFHTLTMASEQPAVSDTPAPSDHPPSLTPAEHVDLPEVLDHHHVPWSVSMPRPYVPQLDRSDFPFLGIHIDMDDWDLPPIPFGFHDAPWNSDDVSGLQPSSFSYPKIYPIFVDSGGNHTTLFVWHA